jgi:hypothetical protein
VEARVTFFLKICILPFEILVKWSNKFSAGFEANHTAAGAGAAAGPVIEKPTRRMKIVSRTPGTGERNIR